MFDWYFEDFFIENKPLFWVCMVILLVIIVSTITFVIKELKVNKHANK